MKIYLVSFVTTIAIFVAGTVHGQTEPLALHDFLQQVYERNAELASLRARVRAEESAITAQYALANPRVGIMREQTESAGDPPETEIMQSWMISQEIMFPSKYPAQAAMQRARASAAQQEMLEGQLKLRTEALVTYYGLFTASRILSLLQAQKATLRDIARAAESRRATGAVSQQDEMKAHVEQTMIESEMLLQRYEITEMRTRLNAMLDRPATTPVSLPGKEPERPKLEVPLTELTNLTHDNSLAVKTRQSMLEEARAADRMAKLNYYPDFMVSYRKPFGADAPRDAYTVTLELSVPLWFFMKQRGESAAAAARVEASTKELEQTSRDVEATTEALGVKVATYADLLRIYETTLIPQATTALNSSLAAYGAGSVVFQDLLDAERSLYGVRIDYYRTLVKYAESLATLEGSVGRSLSNFPFPGGKS